MREMGSREFQLNYQRLSEPVKVVAMTSSKRIIGYFYPGDVPPEQGEQDTLDMLLPDEPEVPSGGPD